MLIIKKHPRGCFLIMLHIIATPIGNLGDVSQRMLDVLMSSDVILVEKWSDSIKILRHFGINPPKLISFDERNQKKMIPEILEILSEGKNISLITSAGTPGVSDPGASLVRSCHERNITVVPIPGPSALSSAISASGLSGDFLFIGFMPKKRGQILKIFLEASGGKHNLIFFESPFRIEKTLKFIMENYPSADVFIGKEMSKKFERYILAKPAEILEIAKNDSKFLKGEFTLIVSFGE